MTTSDYLTQLQTDKSNLVTNLETMGITGLTGNETFTELVPEVLNIQTGGNNNALVDGTKTYNTLYGIRSLITNIDSLTLNNSTNITNLFQGCTNLSSITLFDTSSVTNMQSMFQNCTSLSSVPLFVTSSVINMQSMFQNCTSLSSVPLFVTTNLTNMTYMFDGCTSLIEVPAFSTSNVNQMEMTFKNCTSLTTVPEFDGSKIRYISNIFQNCGNLTTTSLDNILKLCISTTSEYRGQKTLTTLGFTSSLYSSATIQALPHYQDFLDAGWTIGY